MMSKDFFVCVCVHHHHHHHLGVFGYTLLDIRTREREAKEEKYTNKEHSHARLSRTKVDIFGRK